MRFVKMSNWWLESECGRYSVSKSKAGDKTQYTAWHAADIIGGPHDTSDKAKQDCADHKRRATA